MKKLHKSLSEWQAQLTPEQFRVTREKATERAFTGEYDQCFENGVYHCVCCGQALFYSLDKYDAGCGWPSFAKASDPEAVNTAPDHSTGMVRTEILCSRCDAHLGHVFEDGPGPTGLRYCVNSVALKLRKS